ncbi:MAG: hypothetical protein O3A00_03050, partial [Planctomycetota bacterium]|nr:hypothetical protein [Planctomycetota bacterium]
MTDTSITCGVLRMLCLGAICGLTGCSENFKTASVAESKTAEVRPPLKHPVFATPVSYQASQYPAIQVDVLDADETPYLTTAELYLSLQSSRFPDQTRVLLPVNVGDFGGCPSRFVVLPFEP